MRINPVIVMKQIKLIMNNSIQIVQIIGPMGDQQYNPP